jgi:hypothetical protein
MTLEIYAIGPDLSERFTEDVPKKPYVILTGDLDSIRKAAKFYGVDVELTEHKEPEK